jgi:membrane peptidoglycan carboxypeptidase
VEPEHGTTQHAIPVSPSGRKARRARHKSQPGIQQQKSQTKNEENETAADATANDDAPAAEGEQVASVVPPDEPASDDALQPLAGIQMQDETPLDKTSSPRPTPREQLAHRLRVHRKRLTGRRARKIAPVTLVASILFAILFTCFSSGTGAAFAYYQAQLPMLNGIANHSLAQTTRIYDRNGKLLYEYYDQQKGRRTYVNYRDISPLLINATVAAEDHTFWTNSGVDLYGIARAAVSNVQSNGIIEGGSTITQQLVKNQFFLGQKRTFQVKGEEAVLATGLTQQYPKWKIMEMYLNTVFYGDQNYGVESAAESYFRLPPQCTARQCQPAVAHLDLAQASMLAGLPQSPSYYSPTYNKPVALQRQAEVLQAMVDLHMITKAQMLAAQQEIEHFQFKPYGVSHPIQAPHFVWYAIDQAAKQLGAGALAQGGYSVYTTLDLDLEKKVEQTVYDDLYQQQQDHYLGYYGPLNITNSVNNAAAVILNPKNGEILAMDGSANYNANDPQMEGEFNAATDANRQPGSSFKPVVYATAFEMGWYPAMILGDHPTFFPGNTAPPYYSPHNYDGQYHTGFPMTVRNAIANSYNIPAVDTIEYAGINNVLNMAGRLGLTQVTQTPKDQLGPSMALGSIGVSVLSLTSAYATFANQGVRVPPVSVLMIKDTKGQVVYHYDETHPHGYTAMRKDIAFLMSSMLSDNPARYHEFGPGNPLELDRPAAAKTGTTDSFRDNWTLGYTPYLTAGVWAGNSDNSAMQNVIGITGAGPIWHDIMEYASHRYNFPPTDFVPPSNVHKGTVSAVTGLLPSPGEPTVSDWFIDGTMPTIHGSYTYTPPAPAGCTGSSCNTKAADKSKAKNNNADNNNNSNNNGGNNNSNNNSNNNNNNSDNSNNNGNFGPNNPFGF